MSENTAKETKTKTKKTSANKKWGEDVMKLGFCMIPSLIFRAQRRLGLNPTQLAILLQLADYWWEADNKPFPSKQSLSERLGIGTRQIQRHIADMEVAGLVKRIERRGDDNRKLSNHYDLSGLVEKLKRLEQEFTKLEQEVKAKRQKVSQSGGLQ
jgi:DNA-binding MarR family transcriptional regulator